MEEVQLDLGSKIRFFREMKGLSQEALAHQLGITQQAYQKIESGSTKLDVNRAEKIASELGIQLDFLLSFSPANHMYNCTLSSGNGAIHNHTPQELIDSYKQQIEGLKSEIDFLRSQIKNK